MEHLPRGKNALFALCPLIDTIKSITESIHDTISSWWSQNRGQGGEDAQSPMEMSMNRVMLSRFINLKYVQNNLIAIMPNYPSTSMYITHLNPVR